MSARYIAILGDTDRALRAALRAIPGWSVVLDRPAMLLACDDLADRIDLGDNRGTVVGTPFGRNSQDPLACLEEAAVRATLESGGTFLFENYWGSYVAFLANENGVSVIRDPSGATACYVAPVEQGCIATSDVRRCVSLGLIEPAIDWNGVAEHLFWPERRTRRTCIAGVRELMPGSRLRTTKGTASTMSVWTPWRFTSAAMRIDDPRRAAQHVRETVLGTVSAWNRRYLRPLVSLSGGLDSSIVMASTPVSTGAVTMMTHEALGDERDYARAVANRCSVALLEFGLDPDAVDPRHSNAAALPRPVSRLFAQAVDRIWTETIAMAGADALFHGGGGDNVFCYLASATPYLDAMLAGRPGLERRAVLDSLSTMTRVSRWRLRRAALRKLAIDRGRYRWLQNPRMLSKSARDMAGHVRRHPWFEAIPAKTLPGDQAHVAALVRIQNYLEAVEPSQDVPVIAPLMSQPVMEACLRVPTWLWCRDGTNRVVARDAFRDLLPAAVVDRRSKGSPAAFDARLVAAMRPSLRALLHDGHLAARGLIDLDAVDDALGGEGPLRGDGYLRVTELIDVEAWLQSWIGVAPVAGTRQI